MEIFILRNGHQTGPYSEDDTQQMLKQGAVLINDLAWRPGMAEWIPLHSVLYPGPAAQPSSGLRPPPPPAVHPPAPQSSEPATEKQKAFLQYLGLNVSDSLSKEEAALVVNDAMENPKNASRVAKWNLDRLTLHPELFAEELHARKEQRIQHYYEVCQTEGAEILQGITKAHCQVLVGYLDVKFPNWDSNPTEAPTTYFFPAVAEKFPQLVRPEWKGKLHAPKVKVAPEVKRKAAMKPIAPKVRKPSSPVASLVKGFLLGLLLVALTGAGLFLYSHPDKRNELLAKAKAQLGMSNKPADHKEPPVKTATKPAETSTEEKPSIASRPESPSAPPAAAKGPAPSQTAMTPPAAPATPPADGMMTVPGTTPGEPAPAAPPAAGMSLFDPNATTTAPAATDGAMAADSAVPEPKTVVTLTQTIEVQSPYGKLKVPAGTRLPIVEQDGTSLKVRFQNGIITVPVSSTDLVGDTPPTQ